MVRKIKQTLSIHGIFLASLLLTLPLAWSDPIEKPAVNAATTTTTTTAGAGGGAGDDNAGLPGPGASPEHEIPQTPAQIDAWLTKINKPALERKDIEPDLAEAEKKAEWIEVRMDGSGKFKTIMEAVNTVEVKGNDNRVIIDIGPGVYNEKVKIDRYRPYITLYGNPKEPPTITFDGQTMDDATLTAEGDYFVAANIKIMNNSPKKDATGVAVRVTSKSAAFYNCAIGGRKHTLLDDAGKHLFYQCMIEGTTDFIYGDGRSIYLASKISVLPNEPASVITAQARKNTDSKGGGFIFAHCQIEGDAGTKALLGRTYMAGSRVIFAYSVLPNIVEPKGWSDNFDTDYEKTAFFGEYKNTGPGANKSKRLALPCTTKVNDADVKPFLSLDFIDASEWLLPPPEPLSGADRKAKTVAQ